MEPIRDNNRDKTSQSVILPSPIGGWNARDGYAVMPSTDAIVMDNWIPRGSYVELRKGYRKITKDFNIYETLIPYNVSISGDELERRKQQALQKIENKKGAEVARISLEISKAQDKLEKLSEQLVDQKNKAKKWLMNLEEEFLTAFSSSFGGIMVRVRKPDDDMLINTLYLCKTYMLVLEDMDRVNDPRVTDPKKMTLVELQNELDKLDRRSKELEDAREAAGQASRGGALEWNVEVESMKENMKAAMELAMQKQQLKLRMKRQVQLNEAVAKINDYSRHTKNSTKTVVDVINKTNEKKAQWDVAKKLQEKLVQEIALLRKTLSELVKIWHKQKDKLKLRLMAQERAQKQKTDDWQDAQEIEYQKLLMAESGTMSPGSMSPPTQEPGSMSPLAQGSMTPILIVCYKGSITQGSITRGSQTRGSTTMTRDVGYKNSIGYIDFGNTSDPNNPRGRDNVPDPRVTDPRVVPFKLPITITSNIWNYALFDKKLYLLNGVDAPLVYEGVIDPRIIDQNDPGVCDPGGLEKVHFTLWRDSPHIEFEQLNNIVIYNRRAFYSQKDSLALWYSEYELPSSELKAIDLSFCSQFGGSIKVLANWSKTGAETLSNKLIVVTDKGELFVFSGDDPDLDNDGAWQLEASYIIPAPISSKCVEKLGGDLCILTKEGYYSLATLLNAQGSKTSLSNKIDPQIHHILKSNSAHNFKYWQTIFYGDDNLLITNVPSYDNKISHQHVLNVATGAWCRFKGINATSFAVFKNTRSHSANGAGPVARLYVGLADGGLGVMFDADTDGADNSKMGQKIHAEIRQAYSDFGSSNLKDFKLAKFISSAALETMLEVSFYVDFDEYKAIFFKSNLLSVQNLWDKVTWRSQKRWSTENVPRIATVLLNSIPGYYGNINVSVNSASSDVKWYATMIAFTICK